MKVEDKRTNVDDSIGGLKPGTPAQLGGDIGLRSSMLLKYQVVIVLDRETVGEEASLEEVKTSTPVVTLAGEFAWIPSNTHVLRLDATIVIENHSGSKDCITVQRNS